MKRIMLIVVGIFMMTTAIAIDKLPVDVYAENDTTYTITTDNIDREGPEITLTPDETNPTNKSIDIEVKATDEGSGVKEIYVVGENTIRNGDFSKGKESWFGVSTSSESKLNFLDSMVHMQAINEEDYGRGLRLSQSGVLGKGLQDSYVVRVNAKGEGTWSARFSDGMGIVPKVTIDEDEFKDYEFHIEWGPELNDILRIDLINNGELWIDNVEMYETKAIKDNKLTIHDNGTYEVFAVDNAGNLSSEKITIDNIDKENPEITVTQNTNDWTNRDVELTVNAEDKLSGMKSLMYIGNNIVKNGDFSDGLDNWAIQDGNVTLNKGSVVLGKGREEGGGKEVTKFPQNDAFIEDVENAEYYAEVKARGTGTLNVRYGVNPSIGGALQDNYAQKMTSKNEYKTYRFLLDRKDYSNNQLMIERRGPLGEDEWVEIEEIKVFAQKDITKNEDRKIPVSQNGTYTFVAEDNAGNLEVKEHKVTNIDKVSPDVKIIPSTKDKTHENIMLDIEATDDSSGIRKITYVGENMIKNGDFSEGDAHWQEMTDGGEAYIENGRLIMDGVSERHNVAKIRQIDAFIEDNVEGASYYARVTARGSGKLHVRYGNGSGEFDENDFEKLTSKNEYKTYEYVIERDERSNDNLIIEKLGEGFVEISNIEIFAQKDITDSKKLEVTQNGIYTFVVEDNAGNITTKTYEVTNIDKYTKLHKPTISPFPNTPISDKTQNLYTNIGIKIEDWKDSPKWKLHAKATDLTNGDYTLPMSINGKSLSSSIEIIGETNKRGVYEDNSRKLKVEIPPVAKRGKYESKITWELIVAP